MSWRRERRAAMRQVNKATNKFERSMRDVRRDFFRKYNIDYEGLCRQMADARREADACLHDDDIRHYPSIEARDAAKDDPDVFCTECAKLRIRVPIVSPIWFTEVDADPEGCEAFMNGLLK